MQTAAAKFGWAAPSKTTNFTALSALTGWDLYNSVGNAGIGTRSPKAISFANNVMTITGTAAGRSEGMSWSAGQMYGAWEVRMKAPAGAANYDPVLLLWPNAENWPTGGEMDFAEIYKDATRQNVGATLHYSATNQQVDSTLSVDATQWHNYAVAWTPTGITAYIDGVPYFHTTDTSILPPGPMHLCIQLDAVGTKLTGGAQMQVAWAKQYSLSSITSTV